MISDILYEKLNIGNLLEAEENSDLHVLLFKFKTYGNKESLLTFNLLKGNFQGFSKEIFKKYFRKTEKKFDRDLINNTNAANQLINSFILQSIKSLKNSKDMIDEIINNSSVKLSKDILDLYTDKDNIDKFVIDTRTGRIYNLMEIENIEGIEYVKVFRRYIISVGKIDLESIHVPRNEFNKYFKPYNEKEENSEMNEIYNKECELDNNCKSVEFLSSDKSIFSSSDTFEENVINEKDIELKNKQNILLQKSKTLKNLDLFTISKSEVDKYDLELFDVDLISIFMNGENDDTDEKISNYKNWENEEDYEVLKFKTLNEMNENSFIKSLKYGQTVIKEFKKGDTYIINSTLIDLFEVTEVSNDTVKGIMHNIVKIEDSDYIYFMKSEMEFNKEKLSSIIANTGSINNKNNIIKINPYFYARGINISRYKEIFDILKNKFINQKESNELINLNQLNILLNMNGGFIYDFNYVPPTELSLELLSLLDEDRRKIILNDINDKVQIGKNLIYQLSDDKSFNLLLYKMNRQYVYFYVNPFNFVDKKIIRLPLKEFKNNLDKFYVSHMFGNIEEVNNPI